MYTCVDITDFCAKTVLYLLSKSLLRKNFFSIMNPLKLKRPELLCHEDPQLFLIITSYLTYITSVKEAVYNYSGVKCAIISTSVF